MESEVIEFNLKEYREEQLKKKVAKLEEQKKVAMLWIIWNDSFETLRSICKLKFGFS